MCARLPTCTPLKAAPNRKMLFTFRDKQVPHIHPGLPSWPSAPPTLKYTAAAQPHPHTHTHTPSPPLLSVLVTEADRRNVSPAGLSSWSRKCLCLGLNAAQDSGCRTCKAALCCASTCREQGRVGSIAAEFQQRNSSSGSGGAASARRECCLVWLSELSLGELGAERRGKPTCLPWCVWIDHQCSGDEAGISPARWYSHEDGAQTFGLSIDSA